MNVQSMLLNLNEFYTTEHGRKKIKEPHESCSVVCAITSELINTFYITNANNQERELKISFLKEI